MVIHLDEEAKKHINYIDFVYPDFTERTFRASKVLTREDVTEAEFGKTDFAGRLTASDTVTAIFNRNPESPIPCVLNFASYVSPGGGYLNGSAAQEESLCSESNLYNVLRRFEDEYKRNAQSATYGLYRDWAIFSPGVLFERHGEIAYADIVTCAAPNKCTAIEYGIEPSVIHMALQNRIAFILDVMQAHEAQRIILGAFGAGSSGNDCTDVISGFLTQLHSRRYGFSTVEFAIPPGGDNYRKAAEAIHLNSSASV